MFGSWVAGAVARNDKAFKDILTLDDEESAKIAEAARNVARHYDIPLSPQQQAWAALAFVAGGIYAGKLAAYRALRAMRAPPKADTGSTT